MILSKYALALYLCVLAMFSASAYDKCEGYWTEDFQFHRGNFNPQAWMVEQIIDEYG